MKKLTIYLSFILWGSNCTYDHALRVHTLQGMKNVWYVTVVSFTRAQIGGSHVSLTSQVALVIKNLPANAGDVRDKISNSREEPLEEGMYFRLQSSCLENPMDRGAWRATVHRVTHSRVWLQRQRAHTQAVIYQTHPLYVPSPCACLAFSFSWQCISNIRSI